MPRFRWAETKVNENCGEKGPVPHVLAVIHAKVRPFVMPGFVPGIHVFPTVILAWRRGLPSVVVPASSAVVPAQAGIHNPGGTDADRPGLLGPRFRWDDDREGRMTNGAQGATTAPKDTSPCPTRKPRSGAARRCRK
jgi:hypothetical protein